MDGRKYRGIPGRGGEGVVGCGGGWVVVGGCGWGVGWGCGLWVVFWGGGLLGCIFWGSFFGGGVRDSCSLLGVVFHPVIPVKPFTIMDLLVLKKQRLSLLQIGFDQINMLSLTVPSL